MTADGLIFVATSDLAGLTRGKAFPAADLEKRRQRGVGWTPTNVQITCFNTIAESPFGALGDLLLVPDDQAEVSLKLDDEPERIFIGDILKLDGTPWELCTRSVLKSALARLKSVAGAELLAAFEHEFMLTEPGDGQELGYSYAGFRSCRELGDQLMAAVAVAGLTPDTFMKEYGAKQYEITIGPETGVRAADAAMILRDLTRAVAARRGDRATFTPIRDVSSVGNGVHIHMSFRGDDGPLTYDAEGPGGMSALTATFAAGVLKYLADILAFTAPSVISYQRLTPHRWSAAYNNLGLQDREASLRICPVTARDPESIASQFNIEYRAADAAASPHLALAAIVHAGCQGIEEELGAPEITEEDLSLLAPEALEARGFVRLPTTLLEALDRLEASDTVRSWFSGDLVGVYCAHKRGEAAHIAGLDVAGQCAAYEEVY